MCPGLVHTYHGFPFHEFQAAPRRWAYARIERWLGQITDLALCVGTGVAVEAVRRQLISPERIRTIGVVVDGPVVDGPVVDSSVVDSSVVDGLVPSADARARARAALGLPGDATVVGTVGRLTYQKAPEDFLAALQALDRPGVIGVWVGDGELAGQIAAQAREIPWIRVLLTGQRVNIPELLAAFDLFVLCSRYEGLPTAVVEGTVMRHPGGGDGGEPWRCAAGRDRLLVPPGHPALTGAVGFLLDSPGRRAGWGGPPGSASGSANRRCARR